MIGLRLNAASITNHFTHTFADLFFSCTTYDTSSCSDTQHTLLYKLASKPFMSTSAPSKNREINNETIKQKVEKQDVLRSYRFGNLETSKNDFAIATKPVPLGSDSTRCPFR